MTERDRELQELIELHQRIKAQVHASPLAEDGACSTVMTGVFREMFARSALEHSTEIVYAFYDPVRELLFDEFFWFPQIEDAEIGSMNAYVRVDFRQFLTRKDRFFASGGTPLEQTPALLGGLMANLLNDVADEGLLDGDENPHALRLNMALHGLIDDVPGAMDAMLHGFCSETGEVHQAELFYPVRQQLMRNLSIASGINPNGPASSKPFLMPSQAKGKTPAELTAIYFGYTPLQEVFEASIPITIADTVRAEHALIVGGSGHGKSQALLHLIHHDLANASERPPGVIVIDSQGDLIHTIAQLDLFDPAVAGSLADRLILIDPSDVEFPVALNLFTFDATRLEGYSRGDRERVMNSVIDLFEYFFSALLGAELTQKQGVVFHYLARLMMVIPDATVQTLRELMEDGRPYKPYMEKLDGSAKRFFQTEFFSRGFSATKTQILRRLWGVLANPVFERMFSHPENRIDLFEAMNAGKIILIHTAKDHLKADGCSIFGRFFIAKIAQAALERATIPEDDRRPTMLYIDEAHDYFDERLEQLFNQARKYRVGIHTAVQNLDQLPPKARATVMASTSLKFAGGVSAKDARALAEDMNTDADFIRSMKKRRGRTQFAVYVKNKTASAIPINFELGAINALPSLDEDAFQSLIDNNRARYCASLDEIDAILAAYDRAETDDIQDGADDQRRPVWSKRSATHDAVAPAPRAPSARQEADHDPSSASEPEEGRDAAPAAEERSDGSEAHETPEAAPSDALPPEDVRETRKGEVDRYGAGIGGQKHRALQKFVRGLA
ncbi:type IV secretion system DNA-binding domain-containing protein [Maricaulis sp.]|uniref:type IV secretory system conjugative DNA transfer family protein n=1 Tax=Maricaulis sp. TaxID=1486257 RepID=UPI003A92B8B0